MRLYRKFFRLLSGRKPRNLLQTVLGFGPKQKTAFYPPCGWRGRHGFCLADHWQRNSTTKSLCSAWLTSSHLFSLLTQVLRKSGGSGGGDGFIAQELKHLPVEVIRLFRELALTWEAAGRAPHCLNHSRMVNFGKPGKVRAEGVLLVDHCRPITVMSAFWRAWSSAWLQTPTAPLWLQTLPDVVVTGKQSEAALTAAALFTKLNKLQYGASLDFSKCYDLMRPEGTARLLTTGGCPQGITNLLLSVWTSQLLWICWDSHTGEVPLRAGACVPQGCPFGPLALALWVTAGHNAVTAQDNQLFSGICRPYVHCS